MRKFFFMMAMAIGLSSSEQTFAQAPNKGLERHDFFYAGERIQHKMYMVRDEKVVWEYYDPDGKGEISDAVLMSDGHILMAHQHGIKEITHDKEVVWSRDTPQGYEIHSIQPIGKNHVVYVQCGNPMTAVVMEIPSTKIVRQFELPHRKPGGSHGQNRNICLTRKGTLLVASMELNTVFEYDSHGQQLNAWKVESAWGVNELKNGNILIAGNNGSIVEINRKGEQVWAYRWERSEKYPEVSTQKAYRLKNGNTLISNWWNEWSGKQVDRNNPPVQYIEVTPSGDIVWELSSWNAPADLGPSTTLQLLSQPVNRKKMHFGEFK